MRLLIVEDDPDLAEVYKLLLLNEPYPWDIRCVESIAAGIVLVQTWQPKIILLDMLLQDGDGTSLLAAVKSHPDWPHPPAVLVTGTIAQAEEKRLLEGAAHLGAVRVLSKDDPMRVVQAVLEVARDLYPLMRPG